MRRDGVPKRGCSVRSAAWKMPSSTSRDRTPWAAAAADRAAAIRKTAAAATTARRAMARSQAGPARFSVTAATGAGTHASRCAAGTSATNRNAKAPVDARPKAATRRATRWRFRIRGCSRSRATWLSTSTPPIAGSAAPSPAASAIAPAIDASQRGDSAASLHRKGRIGGRRSGGKALPRSQADPAAQAAMATRIATDAPTARDRARSGTTRPCRCSHHTAPRSITASSAGPSSPVSPGPPSDARTSAFGIAVR